MIKPVQVFSTNDSTTRYRTWKDETVPLVYDWLSHRSLSWPHGAIQWGVLTHNGISSMNQSHNYQSTQPSSDPASVPNLEEQSQRENQPYAQSAWSMRSLFLAERTDPVNNPTDCNTLLQYDVRITHELVNKTNDICKPWVEESHASNRDTGTNRDFTLRKRVIHPGEVNRIRLVCPNVVLTHTDSPNLLLWDMDKQPDRKKTETIPNKPTAELTGHTENAEFALDVFPSGAVNRQISDAKILSGGADQRVCLWHLADYEAYQGALSARSRFGGNYINSGNQTSGVGNHAPLSGHTNVIEDVSFQRHHGSSSGEVFVSVGRDSAMILWDSRVKTNRPTEKIEKGHDGDINCCDFGGPEGHTIITGGNDLVIRAWDIRKLRDSKGNVNPQNVLCGHRKIVSNVSWNRFERNVFASGADDGEVLIWRLSDAKYSPSTGADAIHMDVNAHKNLTTNLTNVNNTNINVNNKTNNMSKPVNKPQFTQSEGAHSDELMFRHVGHNSFATSTITDLDWLPTSTDRWCLASISEQRGYGGSALQIWRMSDLVYRDKEAVMEQITQQYDRVP